MPGRRLSSKASGRERPPADSGGPAAPTAASSCSRCTIWYRDNRPSAIAVSLGDRQTVSLPFTKDNALTLVPEMTSKQGHFSSITNDAELLAFPSDLLGNRVAVLVSIYGDLTRLSLILSDHVTVFGANGFRQFSSRDLFNFALE